MSEEKPEDKEQKKYITFQEFRLEAAKSEYGRDIVEFSISTWESRNLVSDHWQILSPNFLRDVNERLKSVLFHVNEARMYYHSSPDGYFEGKAARYLDLLSHPNSHQELFHLGLIPLDFPKKDKERIELKPSGAYDLLDLSCPHLLSRERDKDDYDFFFAVQAALTDVAKTDDFLDFHLTYTFSNNLAVFSRYLEVVIFRKYAYVFQLPDALQTAREWLERKANKENILSVTVDTKPLQKMENPESEDSENEKTITIPLPKLKVRDANIGVTKLSMVQTAILIRYLQKSRTILGDEYLPKKNAAKAFRVLTGYSDNTMRNTLSKIEFENSDLKATRKILEEIISLIKSDLK